MLEKQITVDLIEVVENGSVQVRTATKIMDDGVKISRSFHRHVVAPSDDYAAEADRVKAICAATHTPKVRAEYQASLAIPE
jgi:hypothetical protein